jgi:hypothetical protein
MNPEDIYLFPEPDLEFAVGQRMARPHDGLGLFGPYDLRHSSQPKSIVYGLAATKTGIVLFQQWARLLNQAHVHQSDNPRLWPPYPGFEAVTGSLWPEQPARTYTLSDQELFDAARNGDPYQRASTLVGYYLDCIANARKRDENFAVFICLIPDVIWENCRPKSIVREPISERLSRQERMQRVKGQMDLFSAYDVDDYKYSIDFRRQLKAKSMEYGIPIQIVRESTLRPNDNNVFGQRGLTPLCDRAWNMTTALYYKAGGKPWKLSTARDGVCYLGIAFRIVNERDTTACCAAQMFLDSGDGIVFLGDYGPWYSPEHKQFHLSKEAAYNLLSGILHTYRDMDGGPLKEIFLHSRSSISDDEFAGYTKACPAGVKLVGVRIRHERQGFRLFRPGTRPVLRGTFLRESEKSGFLWANGFKPSLMTYDGWEVPVPLRIDIQHGAADIIQVAQDVLSLTKLNYNTCKLGESQPVTVHFSDAVGEILVNNPATKKPQHSFRFYI